MEYRLHQLGSPVLRQVADVVSENFIGSAEFDALIVQMKKFWAPRFAAFSRF